MNLAELGRRGINTVKNSLESKPLSVQEDNQQLDKKLRRPDGNTHSVIPGVGGKEATAILVGVGGAILGGAIQRYRDHRATMAQIERTTESIAEMGEELTKAIERNKAEGKDGIHSDFVAYVMRKQNTNNQEKK